jgi:AhpD family alkylhydroperoxidase
MNKVQEFLDYRSKMNERILADGDKIIKRIYSVDSQAYQTGKLDEKSKELIGLTCSLVLRCDDCVKYHLEHCKRVGLTNEEIIEAMSIANLVGGTIVIPHLRRAYEYLEALDEYFSTEQSHG